MTEQQVKDLKVKEKIMRFVVKDKREKEEAICEISIVQKDDGKIDVVGSDNKGNCQTLVRFRDGGLYKLWLSKPVAEKLGIKINENGRIKELESLMTDL